MTSSLKHATVGGYEFFVIFRELQYYIPLSSFKCLIGEQNTKEKYVIDKIRNLFIKIGMNHNVNHLGVVVCFEKALLKLLDLAQITFEPGPYQFTDLESFLPGVQLLRLDFANTLLKIFFKSYSKKIPQISVTDVSRSKRASAPTKSLKAQILSNSNYKCNLCKRSLEIWHCDHIIPISVGGETSLNNLQALCPLCHAKKSEKESSLLSKGVMNKVIPNKRIIVSKYFKNHTTINSPQHLDFCCNPFFIEIVLVQSKCYASIFSVWIMCRKSWFYSEKIRQKMIQFFDKSISVLEATFSKSKSIIRFHNDKTPENINEITKLQKSLNSNHKNVLTTETTLFNTIETFILTKKFTTKSACEFISLIIN